MFVVRHVIAVMTLVGADAMPLSDEAPVVVDELAGQDEGWVRDHAVPVRSLVSTDPTDLDAFGRAVGDARIVQLGESGHGVAEFNYIKTRLLRYLYEHHGFDVLLFESPLYGMYEADRSVGAVAVDVAMQRSLHPVWLTDEVHALFSFVRDTRSSDRPLRLGGVDVQAGSRFALSTRADFFGRVVGAVDDRHGEEARAFDRDVWHRMNSEAGRTSWFADHRDSLVTAYDALAEWLSAHEDDIASTCSSTCARIAPRVAWSAAREIELLALGPTRYDEYVRLRDRAMADNVTYFVQEVYPDARVVVWAHNAHVRLASEEVPLSPPMMGSHLDRRFGAEMYTVGLYMNRGSAAWNDRTVYSIAPGPNGTLAELLSRTEFDAAFLDLRSAAGDPRGAWTRRPIVTRPWGRMTQTLDISRQYDGIVYIDRVTPPRYR